MPTELEKRLRAYDPEAKITDRDVADVVRAHSVSVAVKWSGRKDGTVRNIAKRLDGYSRGRGRPSTAELERMPARPDCFCRFCLDTYLALIKLQPLRNYAGEEIEGEWAHLAACIGQPKVFFAKTKSGYLDPERLDFPGRHLGMKRYKPESYERAKRICMTCPVREQCLDHAMRNEERHDVWGGLDWLERDLLLGHLPTGKRFE